MCGRFTLRTSPDALSKLFQVMFADVFSPRFNIAPTQTILAVRQTGIHREPAWFHWGLVPSWAKDTKIAFSTINARGETLAEKPAFRNSFRRKRCLIVADGFYEWRKVTPKTKEPIFFTLRDDSPFGLAGLWDCWTAPDGSVLESCIIVTTTANELVAPLHHRMPVILSRDGFNDWLNPTIEDTNELNHLLAPLPANQMKSEPVAPIINNTRNEVDPRRSSFKPAKSLFD